MKTPHSSHKKYDIGSSSAVSSVLFARGGESFHQETKTGSYVYHGNASNYHEWEFRTKLRMQGKKDNDYIDAASKVVEGLRGDAFVTAQELGLNELWKGPQEEAVAQQGAEGEEAEMLETETVSGIDKLIKAMRAAVFPYTTHEAKELFRQYCKTSGALSRQHGESMMQYISRRKRCWNLLTELDKEIVLSEGHRADMLLDLAGLDRTEKIMIQASIANSREFQKVADALVMQHPRIHLREHRRRGNEDPKEKGRFRKPNKFMSRAWKGGKAQGRGRSYPTKPTAYIADEDEDQDEGDFDEPYNDAAYVADASDDDSDPGEDGGQDGDEEQHGEFAETAQEAAELDAVAYLCEQYGEDGDFEYDDVQSKIGEMQLLGTALANFKKGYTRGKYPIRYSNVSVADRRAKLEELKKKTSCNDCGKRGHWRGDPSCPAAKDKANNSKVKGRQVSQVRMTLDCGEAEDFTLIASDTEDESVRESGYKVKVMHTANMATKGSSSRRVSFQSIARDAMTESVEEWTEVDAPSLNPKFKTGTFKGKFYMDVVREFPQHYFQIARTKSKDVPKENTDFRDWVEQYFEKDGNTLRRKIPSVVVPAQGSTTAQYCSHVNVHHKGSSARYKRFTCVDCGVAWNQEREVPPNLNDPGMCAHINVDHRGSNAHVRRTFCKDCNTIIDTVPQSAHKQQKEWLDSLPEPTEEERAMLTRVMDHRRITKSELEHAINLFTARVHMLADIPTGYSLREICDGFLDSADEACESSRGTRTAYAVAKRTMTVQQNVALRVVDPINDPGVWVLVDDCCNSSCHGKRWRINAEKKFKEKGFKVNRRNSKPHKFDGVGENFAQSTGKFVFPCGLLLEESQMTIPGTVSSHEMEDKDHPLLLSQAAQAKLGFVKDVRDGTITMRDYENQHLEVVRQKGTGLFMIRIDNADLYDFSELVEANPVAGEVYDTSSKKYIQLQETTQMKEEYKIHLETRPNSPHRKDQSLWTKEDWKNFYRDRDDFMRAYMAKRQNRTGRHDRTRSPKVKKENSGRSRPTEDTEEARGVPREASIVPDDKPSFQESDILLVSCSAIFFEESKAAVNKESRKFQNYIGYNGRNEKEVDFNLNYHKTRAEFEKSFRLHFPHLCEGRELTIIDCTRIKKDPDHDKNLRSHTGHHPTTMLNFAKASNFEDIMSPLKSVTKDKKHIVVFVCRKGTHRSVAGLEFADHALEWFYYGRDDTAIRLTVETLEDLEAQYPDKEVANIHLSTDRWFRTCKGICGSCLVNSQEDAEEFVKAREIAMKKLGDILPIDREQELPPDYDAALEARQQERGEDRPTKKGRAEGGSKAHSAHSLGHPIIEKDLEEIIHTRGWDRLYGEFAMMSCAESLLSTFDSQRTVGEISAILEPKKKTIYGVLIYIMRKYGAYIDTVEGMLKDIRSKHGELSLPSRFSSSASSGSQQTLEARSKYAGVPPVSRVPAKKAKAAPTRRLPTVREENEESDGEEELDRARRDTADPLPLQHEDDTVHWQDHGVTSEPTEEPVPRSDDEERGRSLARNENTRKRPRTKPRSERLPKEEHEGEILRSRKDLIAYIDPKSVKMKRWKYDFKVRDHITDEDIEMLFQEEEDMDRTRNHRTYIGPGADGSSNDKICVEFRYRSKDNSLRFDVPWNDYVKTTYVQHHGKEWECIETEIPIGEVNPTGTPDRTIMFVQPKSDTRPTAYFSNVDQSDGECDFHFTSYESLRSFRPDLTVDKKITMNKKQRALITKGQDLVKKQDKAMWSTLTHEVPYTKKVLIFVTVFASLFNMSVGHMAELVNPGNNGSACTSEWKEALEAKIDELEPTLTFIHVPYEDDDQPPAANVTAVVEQLISKEKPFVIVDTHYTQRWEQMNLEPFRCRGDIAMYGNEKGIMDSLQRWAHSRDDGTPRCTEDLEEVEFSDTLRFLTEDAHLEDLAVAFVGTREGQEEPVAAQPIDDVHGDEDVGQSLDDLSRRDEEQEMFEELPLPGNPKSEQERKAKWLALPRRARVAIRRLHRNFRHLPKAALVQMLRAAKADKTYIEAAKAHRCDVCEQSKRKPKTHKVAMPKPYEFNHELGVDVIDLKDAAGRHFSILNAVDHGTTFQQAWIVRESDVHGLPSSLSCLKALVNGWTRWASWPKLVACDRGVHNRGVFGTTLAQKGVRIRPAALESPEQIGRTERRNALLKDMMIKTIKETNAIGRDAVDMALSECLNAINEMSRHGGFAPCQWVLSKFPRTPAMQGDEAEAHDIGAIQAHVNGPTAFALQSKFREVARKKFVKWDCGQRVQRALLRNAAPVPGPYAVGDIVSYCRRPRIGETGIQWSVGSRIVGFEVDPAKPEEAPHTCWVICDGIPVCVSTDKIRPCTSPELLAYHYMNLQNPETPFTTPVGSDQQQSFLDARKDAPSVEEIQGEGKDEELADLFSSEEEPMGAVPASSTKPKEGSKRKELRADVTISEEGSSRDQDAPNPLAKALKKQKITGKGVDIVERIANLLTESDFSFDNRERTGFLQVRLVGGRERKQTKRPIRPKDGEKNLRFSDCTPEIQAGLRRTRAEEWEKWKKYNAGIVLEKEEVERLRAEGVTVQPMQWVETDKNAHKRRQGKHVPPALKSRLVGCGNFEDTTGLRTDSPTADVDAHNLVFSWCACNEVTIKKADIQAAYLQGKPVDRIILYRIPKGGIPECDISDGTIIAARVPIYGTKDAGRGFWLRLKEVAEAHGFKLNRILPTLFSIRNSDGKMIGIMTSNVDDLLYGCHKEAEPIIEKMMDAFTIGEHAERSFRFCGKEVVQRDDYSIDVTAKDNTEKIRPISISSERKASSQCDHGERTCLRSVVAALAWIARQVRPNLSYRVSRMQSITDKSTIRDMRECNKVLAWAQSTSTDGLHFKSGAFNWEEMVTCSITDASFGNDKVLVKDEFEGNRSQQGYIIALGQPDIINAKQAVIHPICWSSTTIRRACRSTLMAETFAMIKGTEAGTRIRAAVVDALGLLDMHEWEESAARHMGHVWFTDCDSLYEHLVATRFNQIENKRLSIDLMALRQQIWEREGERTEVVEHSFGDYPRWIDTSTMLSDPLTKVMNSDRLTQTFMTGVFDMVPTPESLMIKEKNRLLRRSKKDSDGGTVKTDNNADNEA